MKKMFLSFAFFALGSLALSSCSQDDVLAGNNSEPPVSRTSSVVNERITVGELAKQISSSCQDYELDFLNSLPQDMEVYVYPGGSKNYPALKKNEFGEISSLIHDKSIKAMSLEAKAPEELKTTTKASSRGYTVAKSIVDMPILAFTSGTFGYMEVIATFNYIYDIEEHIITEAKNIVCDLDDSAYIGEYVLDWADRGSTLSVSSDKISLLYNVNGDVILGKAIGGLPVGFVCLEFRGKTGEVTVPY